MDPTTAHAGEVDMFFSLLNWLRDPFGTKQLSTKHTDIRRRMVETRVRAEDTTDFFKHRPATRRLVRVNPIEKVVLGNRIEAPRQEDDV